MKVHREMFPVWLMCKVLGVSKSGYFDWFDREDKPQIRRKALIEKIRKIHLSSRQSYGSPRIFRVLKTMGEKVSKTMVERLMKEAGIRAKTKRKFRATTNSKHSLPVAENLASRRFKAGSSNRLWCSDITYLWTDEGWLYLAAILDTGTRKVVGWAMAERMTQELVLDALKMAVKRQGAPEGLCHHSDRGSQYAGKAYQQELARHGMVCSMSRKGNCWDNAVVESFFHTLKVEHVYHERFLSRAAAKSSIFEWIEVFYNRQRLHSALGFLSPDCYEREAKAKCA